MKHKTHERRSVRRVFIPKDHLDEYAQLLEEQPAEMTLRWKDFMLRDAELFGQPTDDDSLQRKFLKYLDRL